MTNKTIVKKLTESQYQKLNQKKDFSIHLYCIFMKNIYLYTVSPINKFIIKFLNLKKKGNFFLNKKYKGVIPSRSLYNQKEYYKVLLSTKVYCNETTQK